MKFKVGERVLICDKWKDNSTYQEFYNYPCRVVRVTPNLPYPYTVAPIIPDKIVQTGVFKEDELIKYIELNNLED